MKILFLAHLFPLPLDSGGKIKSYHTLKALAAEHQVHLLTFTRHDNELDYLPDLVQICHGIDTVPLTRSRVASVTGFAGSVLQSSSFIIGRDYRMHMLERLQSVVNRFSPDVIHIDHLQMMPYVDLEGPYLTVLDQHNVESAIIRRIAQSSSSIPTRFAARIEWPKLEAFEIIACRSCDMVITVSEEDKSAILSLDPTIRNIHAVPIGVDIDYFLPIDTLPGSHNILTIGTMYWPPNVDSVIYFYKEIFPLIREKAPDCTLTIAGQRPASPIKALSADPAVSVTGYLDDIRDICRQCGVFIVPLRSGSGVRVKILNAMAMALPIVTTSVGAEGLEVESGRHLLIADTPQDFANAVTDVLTDSKLADSLGRRARQLACEKYSWSIIEKQLLGIYSEHLGRRPRK